MHLGESPENFALSIKAFPCFSFWILHLCFQSVLTLTQFFIVFEGLVVVYGGLKFIILLPPPPEGAEITGLPATFKSIFKIF